MFVFMGANLLFKTRGVLFSLMLVTVSIALAILSYHLFEKSFLRMKSRFIAIEG